MHNSSMIKEMASNDKTNETHLNLQEKESNDDYIDDDNNNYSEASSVPCFSRLFVIRRIISKYLDSNINNNDNYSEKNVRVKELASMCNEIDCENVDVQSIVFDIFTVGERWY